MACHSGNPDDGKLLQGYAPVNPAFRGEFFGPVGCCCRVKSEDEASALTNDGDFGRGGSKWTKVEARGKRVASRVDTAMMPVTSIDGADAEWPFGGIQHPGCGRERGTVGVDEFVGKQLVRTGPIAVPV